MASETEFIFNIKLGSDTLIIPQKDDKQVKYASNFSDIFENKDNVITLDQCGHSSSIFIKILDNVPSSFSFNQLMKMLTKGNEYFDEFEINIKIKNRINNWVKNLGKYSYTWSELLDKPNYGFEIFKTRFWPFFNVDNKEWRHISVNVLSRAYPNQQDCINTDTGVKNTITEIKTDYKTEYDISQKYNNFLGHSVANTEECPDIDNIILKLQTLKNVNLNLLMFEAILRLFITPTTCHIFKESRLWELVIPLFNEPQFGILYKQLCIHFMYYAMFILNHEDMVMFSQIRRNYRIIFTHHEALNMPLTYNMHIDVDPYIQQLTGEQYLVQSIPYYLRCKRCINTVDIFERRFYLATGGSLANIPLHKFNAAVSGSILIPCLVYSDLEKDFQNVRYDTKRIISGQISFNANLYKFCDNTTQSEKDFMSYLEYYYPSYHSLLDNDYIDQVLTQSIEVSKTIDIAEEKAEKDHNIKYNTLADIDISITSDNYETFNELAQILGKQIQLNCIHIGEVWIKKVYTAAAFKYKLYGPGLIRPIDLFRVPYGPDKMVKKFHCPIVRSWYDGENKVSNNNFNHEKTIRNYWKKKLSEISNESYDMSYDDEIGDDISNEDTLTKEENITNHYIGVNIIQSCLAAALSGVNNSYKWFFSSKPCVEVILKYAQRGFTTIINEDEKTAMIKYMKISPRWKPFIDHNIDIMGMMSQNHIFFHPCIVNAGIRYKLKKFKKSHINTYNKRQYVGVAKTNTEYGVDLIIKNNTKVYHPDVNKINLFVNYLEQIDQKEFSDGDEF
jgi:hypothetical protein